jgi:CheY-like chemotaxis protein
LSDNKRPGRDDLLCGLERSIFSGIRTLNNAIPIVALTAYALKGDLEKCLEAGMDGLSGDPISSSGLKEMLQKWQNGIPASQLA